MKMISNAFAHNSQAQFVYVMNPYPQIYLLDPSQSDMGYCEPL